ncbi:MAG: transglycosylase domain-containing protein [Actinomycetota bacterium]|nr:transglycosylase domain-containing protein [Actinomycetota bacterium]
MARKALIHQIEARERRGRWFGALATLLSMSLLLSGWVGLFAFLGTNSAYGSFEDIQEDWIPDTRSMELTLPDLSRVSRIYADSGEVLDELHDGRNSDPIPYEDVPEIVVHAILAAEDSDFFEHDGVDFSAIASAAIDNIIYDTTRGGSTITQQVVKNAFVGAELTIQRKVNEALVSAELERRFPKERILEFYMNSVYFGSGAYGVNTAAEEFFSKDLDDLEVHEAAALAVLVRNPSLYNPRRRPEITLDRRNDVIIQMAEEGWISEFEEDQALHQPLDVVDAPLRRGVADHVVAEVKRQLLNDDEFSFLGDTNEQRKKAIFGCPADDVACEGGGGLQIFTTIDLDLQHEANRILTEWLPLPPYEQNLAACARLFSDDFEENQTYYAKYAEIHSCQPTGAISMVDNHTGAVKVMASGLPFEFSQFDLVVQGRRNPGSSFKPIGLATALEEGFTMGTNFSGQSPLLVQCPYVCSDQGNVWPVSNAGSSKGVMTLEAATYGSVNTVYAQLSVATGPENIVDMARRMGITESALTPVPSIVLGSSAVSPLEMASAFSNFATNGLHADDYVIARIVDHEGTVIYEHEAEQTQVADAAIFAAARRALVKVPKIGTAARPLSDFVYGDFEDGTPRIGGKTGTHQNYWDAWYLGFTPEYSTAVWVGYEAEQRPLENIVARGQTYKRVFGSSIPAPIWGEFMEVVLEGLPEIKFPGEPANIQEYLIPPLTKVPVVVGLQQDEAEDELKLEARLNVTVVDVASLEPVGVVVNQSIEPGATVSQGTFISIYVSTGEIPVAPMIGLIGLTVEEAIEVVREYELNTGLKLTLVQQKTPTKTPGHVGLIIGTDPPAWTVITESATVVLMVGELSQGGG